MAKTKFAYYPGCVTMNSAREVQDSIEVIAQTLAIDLWPMAGAACCGAGVIKQYDRILQLSLNARTFSQAESRGLDVLTPCASCQGNMHEDLVALQGDEALREKVNAVLEPITGTRFQGTLKMRHLLHVLVEDIGLDVISSKVVNPIDFPIAGYYGAPMQREGACGDDDTYNPQYFEMLIEALGGDSVQYGSKSQSVGFPNLLAEEKTALEMTAHVIDDAKSEGAKILATACPLSHINLDVYQVKAGRRSGHDTDMPVVHLPELVAFAFGHMTDRLAMLRTRIMVIGD